jgi:hypothetical protein
MRSFATVMFVTAVTCSAQRPQPRDSWLMQNYRFAGPPAASEIQPVTPMLAQLQEVQNTTLNILRKANLAGDYQAALAAAAQATANAQLIGAITGRLKPIPAVPPAPKEQPSRYLAAGKDRPRRQ